jgi:hypothetical protein
MKFLLLASAFAFISSVSFTDAADCSNVNLYFIGNNKSDIKVMSLTSSFSQLANTVYFQASRKTVFYTGGWLLNYDTFDADAIFSAYLDGRRSQFNLVYIDWSHYSKDLFFVPMIKNIACV